MPDPDDTDLEARVRRLESEIVRLREDVNVSRSDAAAARVLAGGADRDVSDMRSELRAHTQLLNALRETQIEHGDRLAGQEGQLAQLRSEMRQGFATLHTGMAQIVAMLGGRQENESG